MHLDNWNSEGGTVIALISPGEHSRDLEQQILFLGAAGALTFPELPLHLRNAIYAVAAGDLWFKRDVLGSYVKQTRAQLRRCSASYQRFTTREKQITDFLLRDLPNRVIAQRLAISERTIKFHVSNILRKLNVGSRKELREVTHTLNCSPVSEGNEIEEQQAGAADLHQRLIPPLDNNLS